MTMTRAYSLLEIKELDEDARRITGIATTPKTDRAGDIVMSEGAVYKLPIPFLYQHDSRQPIGFVTEAKVTKKGIEIVAEIAKDVHEDIEKAWKYIKAGLVRGLSIGFKGIDIEPIPNSWGVIFEKWEWLELSAVTIPANADASIQTIKQYDAEALKAATGAETDSSTDKPAATGTKGRVVKLDAPARDRAKPFVIRSIKRTLP